MFDNSRRVFLVRGKDKGREAWHFVLVDEDKIKPLEEKVAKGTIDDDLSSYGQVLHSGHGKDIPEETTKKVFIRFFLKQS
jgi:hypothetical protein